MKKFSFLEKLTDKEIIEILEMNNFKLNLDIEQPLRRGYNKDGEYLVVANCLRFRQEKKLNDISFMNGALLRNVGGYSTNTSSHSANNTYIGEEIIGIKDFYMTEIWSTKKAAYQQKYESKLTKNYQKYMAEKFGDQYLEKAENYFKELKTDKNAEK